ncbi:hypothetical protein Dimus_033995 [Dionaea muscipula]
MAVVPNSVKWREKGKQSHLEMEMEGSANVGHHPPEPEVGAQVHHPATASAQVKQRGKRTKSPGMRIVGGRIYDSVNGKTCHQISVGILG